MLEGALRYLRGDAAALAPLAIQDPEYTWLNATATLHGGGESEYGYCTEFLVTGEGLDAEAVLERMVTLGDSVFVVGDEKLLRIHVHTSDPGAAIGYGTSLGELTRLKVDNIQAQAEEFAHKVQVGYEPNLAPVSTVAVASGRGLEDVFRSLGVTAIVPGGRTMNPSTQQILAAIDSCRRDEVIVLPNNKNVILTAEQAAQHSKKDVKVVPTESIPQGIAALLALNLESGLRENAAIMGEARHQVRTIEVTKAIRSAVIGGLSVRKGQDDRPAGRETGHRRGLSRQRRPFLPGPGRDAAGQPRHHVLRRRHQSGRGADAGGRDQEGVPTPRHRGCLWRTAPLLLHCLPRIADPRLEPLADDRARGYG